MIMWLRFKIAVALFDLGIWVGPEFSSDDQYNRLYKLLKNTHARKRGRNAPWSAE